MPCSPHPHHADAQEPPCVLPSPASPGSPQQASPCPEWRHPPPDPLRSAGGAEEPRSPLRGGQC